jgi:Chaperone of endosialidase
LSGGPITSTGTINLASTQLLPTTACAANQIPKWNGTGWVCAADATGASGGSGTVTSVATGAGLTGGPITAAGTIGLAASQLLPTTACGDSQTLIWNSTTSKWICAAWNSGVTGSPNAWLKGSTFSGGNAFGVDSSIGTTDNYSLFLRGSGRYLGVVNNGEGLVIEPVEDTTYLTSNTKSGSLVNRISVGALGGTIAGGGARAVDFFAPDSPNLVTESFGTVGGGRSNSASFYATVSGGGTNTASGSGSVVSGGTNNTSSGYYSTIPGGVDNVASGGWSFAAGENAKATHDRSFVWAGGAGQDTFSEGDNTFKVYSWKGIYMYAGLVGSGGCTLSGETGGWACRSDRNLKTDIQSLNVRDILKRVVEMPVSSWRFKSANSKHIGPMAQDFSKAFGLGAGDTTISSMDSSGVAFAAIQGLNQKLVTEGKAKDAKISALEKKTEKFEALERASEAMKLELAAIKKKLGL